MPSLKSAAKEARVVMNGLAFGESPRWHDGRLWFCNWGTGQIIAVDADGNSQVMLTVPATLPYSIDWLPDGRLLV
ncbi:MAG: SMP-30/gluconolactonase/LRE family protein, partial [Mesorhizobium sp.]